MKLSACWACCLFGSLLILLGPSIGFATDRESVIDEVYAAEIKNWQQEREKSLTSPTGWLNLAGLYWLEEGDNSFGTDSSNDIVFPAEKGPGFIGSFFLKGDQVTVRINPEIPVMLDDKMVTTQILKNDQTEDATILSLGSFSWFIIERGGRYGVRLRDSESPVLKEFRGLKRFPLDPGWRFVAQFEKYQSPKTLLIPTILGTQIDMISKGVLIFNVDDQLHRLEASAVGDPAEEMLYVIFGDETNGIETYGGGRYLYVNKSSDSDDYIIDFNKAYNPPCAFTDFATCPLPSPKNRLPIRIIAGEKKYREKGH